MSKQVIRVHIALNDNNDVVGYYHAGTVYESYDDIPRKTGLFVSTEIQIITDPVYQGGQLLSLAARRAKELAAAKLQAGLDYFIKYDAFQRALHKDN